MQFNNGGVTLHGEPFASGRVAEDADGNEYVLTLSDGIWSASPVGAMEPSVSGAGVITTVAGTGVPGYSGDGGPATSAQLDTPMDLVVDDLGNVYIADFGSNRVRRVDPAGVMTTVAGTGERGFRGDGGPATSAWLDSPVGVAVDGSGNLYVAGQQNHRVRRVDPAGVITTVAGSGAQGYGGDGGPAARARLDWPTAVAVDTLGNLYIADSNYSSRIRKVLFDETTAETSDGRPVDRLAPADERAFNSRMVGNRIISQVLSMDFVSAGRFILSGRFPGSFSYSNTGADKGTVALILDSDGSGFSGLSLDLQFTSTSPSRGSVRLWGSGFDWFLSGISELGRPPAPLFPGRSGSRLDFFIFDVFERQETRAYDLQVRGKTSPPASWQTGCVDGVNPPTPNDVNFRPISLGVTLR